VIVVAVEVGLIIAVVVLAAFESMARSTPQSIEQLGLCLLVTALVFPGIGLAMALSATDKRAKLASSGAYAGAAALAAAWMMIWVEPPDGLLRAALLGVLCLSGAWLGVTLLATLALRRRVQSRRLAVVRTGVLWFGSAYLSSLAGVLVWIFAMQSLTGSGMRDEGQWTYRIFGAVGVMAVYCVIVLVICMWMERGIGGVVRDRVRLTFGVTCPRCGMEQSMRTHGDACSGCGLRVAVTPT
jgi:hypothetical protein